MFPVLAGNSASTGYNLTRSLRFRSSATATLTRTPASATNRQIFTWSGWVKRGTLTTDNGFFSAYTVGTNQETSFLFAADALRVTDNIAGVSANWNLNTTAIYRDPSSWYHIVIAIDTTQATSTNRVKLYVNGAQVTAFSSATYPTQNFNCAVNNTVTHAFGNRQGSAYFDGYLTEVNFIDGQALTPSSFGSTNALTGVWQPARYAGTYGTNGFYLPFTDNSALTTSSNVGLGKDFSGNGNYWTTNNISITAGVTYDSMTDVPTLTSATAANFCVMNPISIPSNRTSYGSITNANLTVNASSGVAGYWALGTMGVSSGKIYFEVTATTVAALAYIGINGIYDSADSQTNTRMYISDGNKYIGGTASAYGATYTSGDVIGVAVDFAGGTITFYKNNVSQGAITTTFTTVYSCGVTSNTGTVFNCNFGQRPFSYTPPTGFVALNTFNISAGSVTTSGSFTGNLNADGPFVYLNGVPTAMTINGNAVTFGTQADKLANGFKVRTASALYNLAASNTYSVTTNGAVFKNANAQGNP